MKFVSSVLTLVSVFALAACDSSPEDGSGGNGGDGSGASSSNAGGGPSTGGSDSSSTTGGSGPVGGGGPGGGGPGGGGPGGGGPGGGGGGPEPIACCSLFDCPGTPVDCACGSVSGCFITDGECGHCYTEADCDAYCANQ